MTADERRELDALTKDRDEARNELANIAALVAERDEPTLVERVEAALHASQQPDEDY